MASQPSPFKKLWFNLGFNLVYGQLTLAAYSSHHLKVLFIYLSFNPSFWRRQGKESQNMFETISTLQISTGRIQIKKQKTKGVYGTPPPEPQLIASQKWTNILFKKTCSTINLQFPEISGDQIPQSNSQSVFFRDHQ